MFRDPDASLIAIFKNHAIKNEQKSIEAGRPIFDDLEVCEIRTAGSRDVGVFPATAVSQWEPDPDGGQKAVTYAERFRHQYQQFKAKAAQTKSGTPLAHVPFLSEARRAELRAQNIYTVESLAGVDGQELKNLGIGGRELKNKAIEYIEEASKGAPNLQLQAELDALRARNAVLEEDRETLEKHIGAKQAEKEPGALARDPEFDDMTTEQLREFVTANTGHAPVGNVNRKALVRMAQEVRPDKVA